MSVATRLTAEDYLANRPTNRRTELVRGEIVEMSPGGVEHGEVGAWVATVLNNFVRPKQLGRVSGHDMTVVTGRNPDTVRGADVAFFTKQTLPSGVRVPGFGPIPELVFEIRSPNDRPGEIAIKSGEYLNAGVVCVVVLDPETRSANVFTPGAVTRLDEDEVVPLPAPLEDLRLTVREWFG